MPASEEQQRKFGLFERGEVSANSFYKASRATMLRNFYRRGQRMFRIALGMDWYPQEEALNDCLEELNDTEKDGFMMGWQADAWATDHGIPLAVEGSIEIVRERRDVQGA